MLANLLRTMRLRAGSKAVAVGIAAATLVALAGGWAIAGLRPGQVTASTGTLRSVAGHAAGSAAKGASPNLSQVPGSAQTTQPQAAAPLASVKLPTGLVLAGQQALVDLSLRGSSAGSAHSATGGGATQSFHFGFTAQPHRNGNVAGTVTGNAEVVFAAPNPGSLHIEVNCLVIVGNDAYVSGVLTYAAFGLAKGTEMLFGVEDDDSASKPDLISNIYYSPAPAFTCHTFHAKPHYVVQGHIELH